MFFYYLIGLALCSTFLHALSLTNNSTTQLASKSRRQVNNRPTPCLEYPGCDRLMKKWSNQCQTGIYIKKYCPCSCAQFTSIQFSAGVNSFSVNGEFETCCKRRCVKSRCNFLCNYDLSVDKFLSEDGLNCLQSMDDVLYCASSGKVDATDCCRQKNVPSACQTLCRGTLPPFSGLFGLLGCAEDHFDTIVACHRQSAVQRVTQSASQKWMTRDIKKTC